MRSFRIINADVLDGLRTMEPCSFDACLCDPPYGLKFMGKAWDHGVPGAEVWREVLRVLKPGATLLAFGGTRTFHRLTVAIEDAGFEVRDCLMWLYGSGFPKSLDISKALDKAAGAERSVVGPRIFADGTPAHGGASKVYAQDSWSQSKETWATVDTAPATPEAARWNGYGTALKPAWEPVIVAMKPCDGTFAENALKWGVAGVNVDGGRISTAPRDDYGRSAANGRGTINAHDGFEGKSFKIRERDGEYASALGRWPANLLLDEESARMVDKQSGFSARETAGPIIHKGSGGFVDGTAITTTVRPCDSGGASRFYYIAKADAAERSIGGVRNTHPTVKPIDLCAYLAKLILPPERETPRRLLVPFSGSGSEIMGALRAGWNNAVGIENNAEYVALAERRIEGDAPLFNAEITAPQPQPIQEALLP